MSKKSKAMKFWESRAPSDRLCYYCERQTIPLNGAYHPANASIDHAMPKCRKPYGQNDILVLSCAACNNAKGDMTADEFIFFIKSGQISPSYVEWLVERTKKLMQRR